MPAGWQVFIHDPLYKWAMTPTKAQQRQRVQEDADAGAANAGAHRTEPFVQSAPCGVGPGPCSSSSTLM